MSSRFGKEECRDIRAENKKTDCRNSAQRMQKMVFHLCQLLKQEFNRLCAKRQVETTLS